MKSGGARLVFEYPTHEVTSGGVAVTERGALLCIVSAPDHHSIFGVLVLDARSDFEDNPSRTAYDRTG